MRLDNERKTMSVFVELTEIHDARIALFRDQSHVPELALCVKFFSPAPYYRQSPD